ncbi:hypothetical protein DFH09DRAFT_1085657 [Mycena vulgaris]|nr:hypothetical protein DFH09DRAFT_1085657 [Mycena vulgaris]
MLCTYAAQWRRRGVSAFEPSPPQHAQGHTPFVFGAPPPLHSTLLHPSPPSAVLPPSYALHAAGSYTPRAVPEHPHADAGVPARADERVRAWWRTEALRISHGPAFGCRAGCKGGGKD